MAEMGVRAARDALEAWGGDPARIGAVICAASNMQRAYPAMAFGAGYSAGTVFVRKR
jgi:beta-ketodecanoyl-[acyl-carrier-protein] synthase